MLNIKFTDSVTPANLHAVFVVTQNNTYTAEMKHIEEKTGIDIAGIIKNRKFTGEHCKVLCIPTSNSEYENIILIGLGNTEDITQPKLMEAGAKIVRTLKECGAKKAAFHFVNLDKEEELHKAMKFLQGCYKVSYNFTKYKMSDSDDKKEEEKVNTIDISVIAKNAHQLNLKLEQYHHISTSVAFTKDLILEPPNVKNPEFMENACKKLEPLGVKVEVLHEDKLRELGMNALLGVAQGSENPPRVVIMSYNGAPDSKEKLALVGKGVTFDSGGLSLKPSPFMEAMKGDMAGSAVVTGTIRALALRKAKVNVVGLIGLVENMPDGKAQRPGDIVRSMSGQTIEVLNTDAEGRLVLADVLWYAHKNYQPKFILDFATLTGAMRICLGTKRAGLFSNNDEISDQLINAGEEVGEKLWRLPVCEEYNKLMDSKLADMKNIASPGSGAGSTTAAVFLQRFVGDTPWAHLDIAAVSGQESGSPHIVTAFGVRLAINFIEKNHSK